MSEFALDRRPGPDEYGASYAGYVAAVPDGDVLATLEREGWRTLELLRAVSAERTHFAYAPGKWTVREVLCHVDDSERVFAYRALRFGRGDSTPLAGFDQDPWVPRAHAGERRWSDLIDEFRTVRGATLHLFRAFEPDDWVAAGVAAGARVTVRALAWIIAGHELHHRRILIERYGLGGPSS